MRLLPQHSGGGQRQEGPRACWPGSPAQLESSSFNGSLPQKTQGKEHSRKTSGYHMRTHNMHVHLDICTHIHVDIRTHIHVNMCA